MKKRSKVEYAVTKDDIDMIHELIHEYGFEQAVKILTIDPSAVQA